MTKITGTLRNARPETWDDRVVVVRGHCYGDIHGRFDEGEWIRTSYVKEARDGMIFTRNSVYKVDDSVVEEVNKQLANLKEIPTF